MPRAARRIALMIRDTGKATAGHVSTPPVIGEVVKVAPLRIAPPFGEDVSFTVESLMWTQTAESTRETWLVGDNVLMVQLGGMYLIIDRIVE